MASIRFCTECKSQGGPMPMMKKEITQKFSDSDHPENITWTCPQCGHIEYEIDRYEPATGVYNSGIVQGPLKGD